MTTDHAALHERALRVREHVVRMATDSRCPSEPLWNSTPGTAAFGCQ